LAFGSFFQKAKQFWISFHLIPTKIISQSSLLHLAFLMSHKWFLLKHFFSPKKILFNLHFWGSMFTEIFYFFNYLLFIFILIIYVSLFFKLFIYYLFTFSLLLSWSLMLPCFLQGSNLYTRLYMFWPLFQGVLPMLLPCPAGQELHK